MGIDVLSITDHDTTAAYLDLGGMESSSTTLVYGIEFSTQHRDTEVHILGLNVAIDNYALRKGIDVQQVLRIARAERIAEKLVRKGVGNPLPVIRTKAGNTNIGRLHFARHLVDTGTVKSVNQAFQQFLGRGKCCFVKPVWTPMPQIIEWIRTAGGTAALAHPSKYNLTGARLDDLLDAFREAGGQAMEVISGQQTPELTRRLARLSVRKGLLATCGSDFHQPDQPWSELGRFPAMPPECTPVWKDWQLR